MGTSSVTWPVAMATSQSQLGPTALKDQRANFIADEKTWLCATLIKRRLIVKVTLGPKSEQHSGATVLHGKTQTGTLLYEWIV